MADGRPRSQRPRRRAGRRLADLAAVERRERSVLELKQTLEPEVESLRGTVDRVEVVERIRARATALAEERGTRDPAAVVSLALDEIFGLGPLEPLLRDRSVRALRVEGATLFADGAPVERGFRDEEHARAVVERILRAVGSAFDGHRWVHVSLVDGSSLRARLDGQIVHADVRRPWADEPTGSTGGR